ncbi:hypothetical protein [Streptomyces sp. NBC_00199]|uniref:hypothetical protein n=1 Tax=Streptomyces sp. NBC_00199 TaxID=2975678 RepID=UPI00224CB28B|nr:hypothetical protein [Streptomyces sp. NBC_00199]MCX5262542.1 hypothetical protein [Streptomyces sp. NBC_00199]
MNAVPMPMTVLLASAPMEVTAGLRAAGDAVVAVGEVDGALLVEGLDEGDPGLVVEEGVGQ